jgi:hypothetical protein
MLYSPFFEILTNIFRKVTQRKSIHTWASVIKVSFCGELLPLDNKKIRLANPTKGFLRFKKKDLPNLEKKKVKSCQI